MSCEDNTLNVHILLEKQQELAHLETMRDHAKHIEITLKDTLQQVQHMTLALEGKFV
jgi:hypothetical protein